MAPTRPKSITQDDKLRAIRNLQSEITRRARSLRAEYARAAQSLRSKLEMRIYRIPKAMRQANMGELLKKYTEIEVEGGKTSVKVKSPLKESVRPMPAAAFRKPSPGKVSQPKKTTRTKAPAVPTAEAKPTRAVNASRTKGVKRNSEIMIAADNTTDKENEAIANPKKRARAGADVAPTRSVRDPNTILSPKSSNSRTLPQSPVRNPFGAPAKGFSSRPASPLKLPMGPPSPVRQTTGARPAATGTTRSTAAKATKATTASTRAAPARGAAKAATRMTSNSSNASTATTGTTIVRKGATSRAGTTASTAKKATATANTAASARRTAANKAKTEVAPTETGTRRVLRKRG